MKKGKYFTLFQLLIVSLFLVFASSCEKDDDNEPNWKTTAVFNPDVTYGTMTDQDDNVYKTVTIGTQTWMAENLRTTIYNDETTIPNITDGDEWGALTTGAYCNYNNTTSTDTIATYGRLYNWYAVNTGKLAPEGWHIPTDEEWKQLEMYLGLSQSEANETGPRDTVGGKLKEIGTTHWNNGNIEATNETGFTALPGGCRQWDGSFDYIGSLGFWLCATEEDFYTTWYRLIYSRNSDLVRSQLVKKIGFSVRCVMD